MIACYWVYVLVLLSVGVSVLALNKDMLMYLCI